jgi:hypothetical protein
LVMQVKLFLRALDKTTEYPQNTKWRA